MDNLTVQVRRNQTTHRAMLHVSPVLCIFRDSRAHTASMSSDLCNMAQEKVQNGSLRWVPKPMPNQCRVGLCWSSYWTAMFSKIFCDFSSCSSSWPNISSFSSTCFSSFWFPSPELASSSCLIQKCFHCFPSSFQQSLLLVDVSSRFPITQGILYHLQPWPFQHQKR